jgi:hypothetical protein
MMTLVYVLAALGVSLGAVALVQWLRGCWRTRRDRGYDASKYGAF